MRMLVVALLLVLAAAPLARAGEDDPATQSSPAAAWVERYLSPDPSPRGEAEAAFLRLTPEAMLEVLARLRARVAAPSIAEAVPQPPEPDWMSGPLVNLELRFLEIDPAEALALLGPATAVSCWRPLDDEQMQALLRALAKSGRSRELSAPRITTYNTQQAHVEVLDQVSFIQDYDVEVGNGGASIADPIIGTLGEGVVVDVRPVVSFDKKHVHLELTLARSEVVRPIQEQKLTLPGSEKEVTIQVPEVRVRKRSLRLRVPDGGHVLVGSDDPSDSPGGTRLVILVNATIVELDEPAPDDVKQPGTPK